MAYSINAKDYFETYLYTPGGSGGHTNSSLNFQPDWVWFKLIGGTESHGLYDAVRGVTKRIKSNSDAGETTESSGLTSFTSNGWVTGADGASGSAGQNYVSWNWKAGGGQGSSNTDGSTNSLYTSASPNSGFSIVTYTGNGANRTIGHGLGVAPKMIFTKQYNGTRSWYVGANSVGWGSELYLNSTAGSAGSPTTFNSTAPTSSVFSIGSGSAANSNGETFVAYCFADIQGFSQIGRQYIGNANTNNGVFVYTGFKPAWVMIKKATGAANSWCIGDNKRSSSNTVLNYLLADNSDVDETGSQERDFLSNGFKIRNSNNMLNTSGETYIFMAFAEQPFVTSSGVPTTAR